jgi:hypothetical protein
MADKNTLRESIAALEDETYNFDPMSGYRIELYLNPETRRIYRFDAVGAGVPERVWNGIDQHICSVPARAIPDSVRRALDAVYDTLESICDDLIEVEWDGLRPRARWRTESWGCEQYLIDTIQIGTYWDPDDWWEYDRRPVDELIAAGKSPQEIYDALDWGSDAYDDGCVQESDAIEWLEELIAESRE